MSSCMKKSQMMKYDYVGVQTTLAKHMRRGLNILLLSVLKLHNETHRFKGVLGQHAVGCRKEILKYSSKNR